MPEFQRASLMIYVECEFITDYEGDRSDPYGFMIHVLDNEKTVLTEIGRAHV